MNTPTNKKAAPLEREHGKAGELQKSRHVNGTVHALARLVIGELLRPGFDARRRRYENAAIRNGGK